MSGERSYHLLHHDLSLPELYRTLARRWAWLVLAVVLGGAVGLVASLALPSAYRATASLGIAVDYGRTHRLDAAAERAALLQVQELLLADETLAQVIERAPAGSLESLGAHQEADLRTKLRIDRFENRWDLSVTGADPEAAATLANLWVRTGTERLRAALEHAVRARDLQSRIYQLGCQLETSEGAEGAIWRCERDDPAGAGDLPSRLVAEVEASHGVLPGLSFAQLREASPPGEPIYRGRTGLLLGGVLLGLAAGLLIIVAWPTARP